MRWFRAHLATYGFLYLSPGAARSAPNLVAYLGAEPSAEAGEASQRLVVASELKKQPGSIRDGRAPQFAGHGTGTE